MSGSFLSSEEFADQAHNLYSEGRFDEAIDLLRQALSIYPASADLHASLGYARLAREEYAWARSCFEQALALDAESEDALAGLGETLLKFGERVAALRLFDLLLTLGYREDHDLMLQLGRALFREGMFDHAREYFRITLEVHPNSAEAEASLGYALHRLGHEARAVEHLEKALELDPYHSESRIYLGNLLYDRGDYEKALFHYERTTPDEHFDELAVWRFIELKRSIYRLTNDDPEILPWMERIRSLTEGLDPVDVLLNELEAKQPDGSYRDPLQIDMFGTLLTELEGMKRRIGTEEHWVRTRQGTTYAGTWEEIVRQMSQDDPELQGISTAEYMRRVAARSQVECGVALPSHDPEAFVRAVASLGLLRIIG